MENTKKVLMVGLNGVAPCVLLMFDGNNIDDWRVKMNAIGFQEVDEVVKLGSKELKKNATEA